MLEKLLEKNSDATQNLEGRIGPAAALYGPAYAVVIVDSTSLDDATGPVGHNIGIIWDKSKRCAD